MEKKKRLAGKRVYIDHDLTGKKRRIQRELRERGEKVEKQKLGTGKYI